MKMTKEELNGMDFYIVPEGFQVMDPSHVVFEGVVSHESGIRLGKKIFCTELWYKNLMDKLK